MALKKTFFFVLLFFACFDIFSLDENILSLFNSKLTSEEVELLDSEEPVIRCPHDIELVALEKTEYYQIEKIRQTLEFLYPNYLAEVICVLPYEGHENLSDMVEGFVFDVPSFTNIPFSKVEKTEQPRTLFSDAEKVNQIELNNRTIIDSKFRIKPLSKYRAKLDIEKDDENFVVIHVNVEDMRFCGIPVAKAYKVLAGLSVVRIGDKFLIYGCGGANAWKPEGEKLKKKFENMFASRISDFIYYYIEKVKENPS